LNPIILGKWIKEAEKGGGLTFRGNGKLTLKKLEILQLNEENIKLKMEFEIFKKVTIFFVK